MKEQSLTERKLRLPLSYIVACTLLIVAVLSSGAVLLVGLGVADRNTRELLAENVTLVADILDDAVAQQLGPATRYAFRLARMIERKPALIDDWPLFADRIEFSLLTLPQVKTVAFVAPDLKVLRVNRRDGPADIDVRDWSGNEEIAALINRGRVNPEPYWGRFFYSERSKVALLNYHHPVWLDGRFRGSLIIVISIDELSRFVGELAEGQEENSNFLTFILYDRDFVLAHPLFLPGFPGLNNEQPLPALGEFPDPILREIWRSKSDEPSVLELPPDLALHRFEAIGTSYYALTTQATSYGPKSWTIGLYLPASQAGAQVKRLDFIAYVAFAVLLVSFALSILLARWLSRPVRAFAHAAGRIEKLDLSQVGTLPPSLLVEIDQASTSMNSMTGALRIFATYVPRALVNRLIALRGEGTVQSEERRITVMFTDIAGFTGLSEQTPAAEIAEKLNHHFLLLGRCIEDTGGTIDKYIGDSVMAIWGAPEIQPDMEVRACRAALEIAKALEADNAEHQARGGETIQIRIGIHSGPAVVGNIGYPGRVNYTVVGDTVNSAQRLETMAKTIAGDETVKIIVSADTASRLDETFLLEPIGALPVKGREAPLEALRLHTAESSKSELEEQTSSAVPSA